MTICVVWPWSVHQIGVLETTEEHKLVLRGDISFIKQETFLTKAFDSSKGATLTGLPTFDSFQTLIPRTNSLPT